ncbi:DUF3892 domain-containing protein [Legionella sp. 31fI33]|uniref:DUF3892 domain-containing protein n=1 Tax=Legionella sp. 31fI33 TaxID=2886376 RepID=UPI00351CEBAC|nr:DUF3892 domain-containing protein [Legionella sp. 31fI33]
MAIQCEVVCIKKVQSIGLGLAGRYSETITHIGYIDPTTHSQIVISKEEAIKLIERRTHSFFVHRGLRRADVIVVGSPPYLKTVADSTSLNNLSNLPECNCPLSGLLFRD